MLKIFKKEIAYDGHMISVETGRIARNVASVYLSCGGTSILCTISVGKDVLCDIDFLPLKVIYQEKSYATGRIPGGFLKREGKASERETLISRVIDRSIRSIVSPFFRREINIVCEVKDFSLGDVEFLSVLSACVCIAISGVPLLSIVAPYKIGLIDSEFVSGSTSEMDMLVVGNAESIVMVDGTINNIAYDDVHEAVDIACKQVVAMCDFIINFAEEFYKSDVNYDFRSEWLNPASYGHSIGGSDTFDDLIRNELQMNKGIIDSISSVLNGFLSRPWIEMTDFERLNFEGMVVYEMGSSYPMSMIKIALREFKKSQMSQSIFEKNKKVRLDGRLLDQIRTIECNNSFLKNSHGSALFTRGKTQTIVSVVVSSSDDAQIMNTISGEEKNRLIVHYNFPPFAVSDVGKIGSPVRREIGHGALARRALLPIFPSENEFPYVIRIVSDVTESDGSSSMATICGSVCALRDAGIPIKQNVAGIAVGVIEHNNNYLIISDITGQEDELGIMDLKVAGTANGVTAIQCDVKKCIPVDVFKDAMKESFAGLGKVLKVINNLVEVKNFNESRVVTRVKVGRDVIKELLFANGKKIKELSRYGAKVTIERDEILIWGDAHVRQVTEEELKVFIGMGGDII